MSSQTQILPFTLLFCVSDTIYPEVSAAESPGNNLCDLNDAADQRITVDRRFLFQNQPFHDPE